MNMIFRCPINEVRVCNIQRKNYISECRLFYSNREPVIDTHVNYYTNVPKVFFSLYIYLVNRSGYTKQLSKLHRSYVCNRNDECKIGAVSKIKNKVLGIVTIAE